MHFGGIMPLHSMKIIEIIVNATIHTERNENAPHVL